MLRYGFSMEESEKRDLAWVGDAVLSLYAREWILKQSHIHFRERTDAYIAMTSNQFLSSIGEPTQVEATIGKLYRESGESAAFEWIERELIPVYVKQQRNRRKGNLGAKRS